MAKRRAWGGGQVVPPKRPGGPWGFRWHDRGGRRRFKGRFTSRVEAVTFGKGVIGDIARERADLPPDPRQLPDLATLAKDWIERRQHTHRSWTHDRGRWDNHLAPHFSRYRAPEVSTAIIRDFVEGWLKAKGNKTTLGLCIRCLSTFFSDLCERPRETGATSNPVAALPKSLRRLYRSEHDSRFTPYIHRAAEVRTLFLTLPDPIAILYALGAFAGLRTAEQLAIEWTDIFLDEPRINVRWQVQNGKRGPLKDDEARILQGAWLAPLVSALRPWKARTGGRGLVVPPELAWTHGRARCSSPFVTPKRLYEALAPAAAAMGRADLLEWDKPWYGATRHTFASHWVKAGRPIAQLAGILGHSTTWVTERYAHVRPEDLDDTDLLGLDLGARQDATVVPLKNGQPMGSRRTEAGDRNQDSTAENHK